MNDWSVYLEIPHRRGSIEAIANRVDDLLEALGDHAAVGSPSPKTLGVQLSVEAKDAEEATQAAKRIVAEALKTLGFGEPIVLLRVEAQTMEDLDREIQRSNIPELVGVAETAAMLGVSKQRASELARSRDFPPPIAMLAAGPVWLRSSIAQFVGRWARQPGRPAAKAPTKLVAWAARNAAPRSARERATKPDPKRR